MATVLRIGCGCGFWGDSAAGPAQLVAQGGIDVLVLDYLSEITLSLLARARRRRPEMGYAPDFVSEVMRPLAAQIAAKGIKVVANAGGMNPQACRDALQKTLEELGVRLSIAVVLGDDISAQVTALRNAGVTDLESGAGLPSEIASANAYLGAFPIAQALAQGADIVITGRCADSSMALAPLIHAFGWQPGDLDQLAMGSLAGHIIECGPQATGGIFTDWRASAADWDDIGYPIVECSADGTFIVTKPHGTGGLVTAATVAEQIVYEVHDPARYILPDVVCDFSAVQLADLGADRVRISGARGMPATATHKASLTYPDGYRCTATLMIVGPEAVLKAEAVAAAIIKRTRRMFQQRGWADYRAVSIEVLGAEAMYGPHARARDTREVILKVAVSHASEAPLELFTREIFPSATSMAQGITGFAGGRPAVQPVVRLASCLIAKPSVPVTIEMDGVVTAARVAAAATPAPARARGDVARPPAAPIEDGPEVQVALLRLAHGRSGDKGDTANIGVLARRAQYLPLLERQLTAAAVHAYMAHLMDGDVERYDWPGLGGWNFVLRRALGGGGIASLRYDPQGKSYAQILMDMPVRVPATWLGEGGPLGGAS